MIEHLLHTIKELLSKLGLLEKTNKELAEEVSRLSNANTNLEAEKKLLEARLSTLTSQGRKNSRNSSKPPSTDKGRVKKNRPKNSRQKSIKPSGAQLGNKGHTLKQVHHPEEIIRYTPEACICGTPLVLVEIESVEKRQEFDIGKLSIEVVEHQSITKVCNNCGKKIKGVFPDHIKAPVQYGPRIRAGILDLNIQHFLSYERIQLFFSDWFNHSISSGLISDSLQKGHQLLDGIYKERLINSLQSQKVLHTDETGLYYAGKRNWLHVVSTPKLTLLYPHESRGSLAIEEMGVLPTYTGRIIHDNYTSYPTYNNCEHGLCNAHHLRELLFFEEEQNAEWAADLGIFLRSVKLHIDVLKQENKTSLTQHDLDQYQKRYHQILKTGYENLPPAPPRKPKARGRPAKHPQHNLLDRLMDKKEQVLAFMYDFDVPFDNNQAERDIRMVKTKQKVSGTFRSKKGALAFASIRGYISTAKKNAISVFEALTNLAMGKPDMTPFYSPE